MGSWPPVTILAPLTVTLVMLVTWLGRMAPLTKPIKRKATTSSQNAGLFLIHDQPTLTSGAVCSSLSPAVETDGSPGFSPSGLRPISEGLVRKE